MVRYSLSSASTQLLRGSKYSAAVMFACLFIYFYKAREIRLGRSLVPFIMESGNSENVTGMVPTAFYSQNQRSMWRSTVVNGQMERSMYVSAIMFHMHATRHIGMYGQWCTCPASQGYGTYFYKNSSVYEGEWSEDQRSGWGRIYYANGDIYEGKWLKDKNHGEGIFIFCKRKFSIHACESKLDYNLDVIMRLSNFCLSKWKQVWR